MADVGGEAGVALDAQLQRRRHVVERAGEHAEVGVVGRRQAGVEVPAGDRLGRLRRVGDRAHGAAGGEHAEQHAEQRRDDAGEQQRQGDVGQRAVVLGEVEELEVGADLGERDAEDDHRLVADVGDHPRRDVVARGRARAALGGIASGAEAADAGRPRRPGSG